MQQISSFLDVPLQECHEWHKWSHLSKKYLKIQSSFKRDELQFLGTQLLLYLKKFWYHPESCSQYLASSSKLNSNIENIIFNLLLIFVCFCSLSLHGYWFSSQSKIRTYRVLYVLGSLPTIRSWNLNCAINFKIEPCSRCHIKRSFHFDFTSLSNHSANLFRWQK